MPVLPDPPWWDDWLENPTPTAELSCDYTPRRVVAVLLGPDGEPLVHLLDRPPVTGFAAYLIDLGHEPPPVEATGLDEFTGVYRPDVEAIDSEEPL